MYIYICMYICIFAYVSVYISCNVNIYIYVGVKWCDGPWDLATTPV